jgi:TM2 domain-containing membrane protein YozV
MSDPNQPYPPYQPPTPPPYPAVPPDVASKKLLAGIMGILFGGLGIHRFILGDVTGGILRIVITVLTCGLGSIIGLIEGIIYLVRTDAEFHQTYLVERRAWF